MGAPVGNSNGAKGKEWRDAIRLALGRRGEGDYRKALTAIAATVVEAALNGDKDAWREIGDRLDGKAMQSIEADIRGSLTQTIEALPMARLRAIQGEPEVKLLPEPGAGQ